MQLSIIIFDYYRVQEDAVNNLFICKRAISSSDRPFGNSTDDKMQKKRTSDRVELTNYTKAERATKIEKEKRFFSTDATLERSCSGEKRSKLSTVEEFLSVAELTHCNAIISA